MLLRKSPEGTIAITQTTHAWVSGQMAQAWGNDRFGQVQPRAAVCLAAEQHDIGWTGWEPEPSFNSDTGMPHSFLELPPETHLRQIWSRAGNLTLLTSRYAALLVSLHGTNLYGRFRGDPNAAGGLAVKFLEEQDAFQGKLLASLADDPRYARFTTDEVVRRNQRLVALWDRLSLNICWGMSDPMTIDQVPLASGEGSITLTPTDGGETIAVDPWPFQPPEVRLIFEGRRLSRTFTDRTDMLQGLAEAPWTSLETTLRPA